MSKEAKMPPNAQKNGLKPIHTAVIIGLIVRNNKQG
jgi:hypothetical protein